MTTIEAAKDRILLLLREEFPNSLVSVDRIASELHGMPKEVVLQACLRLKRRDKRLVEARCFRLADTHD